VQRYLLLKVVASRPKSVITQAQASDQWAYYQAKGIKSYIYQLQVDKLALEVEVLQSENQKLSSIYSDKIKDYKKRLKNMSRKNHKHKQKPSN
jgi:hypothetical protein